MKIAIAKFMPILNYEENFIIFTILKIRIFGVLKMKGKKIGHAPSLKERKSDMPYSELLAGIDLRLKNLRDAEKAYSTDVVKFTGLIDDGRSRIDELESLREWIVSCHLKSGHS